MNQQDEPLLSMQGFGVAFNDTIILASVTLDIPERGIFTLMGPAGTGKSTLLRTICGLNSPLPSLRTWGKVYYAGTELFKGELPVLVAQNAKLLMATVFENIVYGLPERESLSSAQKHDVAERLLIHAGLDELVSKMDENVVNLPLGQQRHLAILRTSASSPKLICIDEPTSDLDDEAAQSLLKYIEQQSQRSAVLIVLHNQTQAKQLGGNTALLAGGWIQDVSSTQEFFTSPQSDLTKHFIVYGNCTVPPVDAKPEEIDPDLEPLIRPLPKEARKYKSDSFGPRNFLWLKKGVLAGTPKPGLLVDIEDDLKALKRVGITVLVSLTEEPIDPTHLAPYDIAGIAFPVVDMGVPTIDAAIDLCKQVETLIENNEAIAMHCKAGMGRTGTALATQLIWDGHTALDALETVRRVEPRWVQSEEQVKFLEEFARAVADSGNQIDPTRSVKAVNTH
ncbi:MAG: ATP-binding cassette domain-containing protein [Gammaproteobacteria bacterium]|nr:ATP-binding cassette domain-containing protein [Gammaproteobacteria bacterium]